MPPSSSKSEMKHVNACYILSAFDGREDYRVADAELQDDKKKGEVALPLHIHLSWEFTGWLSPGKASPRPLSFDPLS